MLWVRVIASLCDNVVAEMRIRHALLVSVTGVALFLVLLLAALLRFPSTDDQPLVFQQLDDDISALGYDRPRSFRYDSQRNLTPVEQASLMVVPDSGRMENDRHQKPSPEKVFVNELTSLPRRTSKS